MKTDWELNKILLGNPKISSTCVRVPVERSHAADILLETRGQINYNELRYLLQKEPMIYVRDSPQEHEYPMPNHTSGKYQVEVGRIRHPVIFDHGVRMFVCGDQLLRGAALNAVLIAKTLKKYDRL